MYFAGTLLAYNKFQLPIIIGFFKNIKKTKDSRKWFLRIKCSILKPPVLTQIQVAADGHRGDHRSFGDLFYACCDEIGDISFVEALYRVLQFSAERLRKLGNFCETTFRAFFDAVIETALKPSALTRTDPPLPIRNTPPAIA